MSPTGGLGSGQAGTGRIYAIHSLIAALAGDYDASGVVDAADYVLWRDTLGSSSQLAADGDRSGTVDAGDYAVWRRNFGLSAPARSADVSRQSVPEPSTLAIAAVAAFLWLISRLRT
jgi:hypothetical protein